MGRWNAAKGPSWEPPRLELVAEVAYEQADRPVTVALRAVFGA